MDEKDEKDDYVNNRFEKQRSMLNVKNTATAVGNIVASHNTNDLMKRNQELQKYSTRPKTK
jgi:hypothetical protein